LEIGVNKNRDSPYNMAVLTGESYSATNLGFIYLVPVHYHITTQDDFFEVHVSAHSKKKELIDGGGTTRKASTRALSCARCKTLGYTRSQTAHGPGLVLERSRTQNFKRKSSCASPSSEVRALSHPRKL
jgi:hypothetical protein